MENQLYPQYNGTDYPNPDYHDGQLRPAIGASSYQVTRANRWNPADCEDVGWTYNHAADLTFFQGNFYLHYLSVPAYEHISPAQSYLVRSRDGIHWEKPRVSFPPYKIPAGAVTDTYGRTTIIPDDVHAVMHQRMAFYQTGGKLLVLGFYGHCDCPDMNPFRLNGIGRVVRELYPDGSFSPIYFIRYNAWAGWTPDKLLYPMYTEAKDKSFIKACEALLADKLAVQQWIDEHGEEDELLTIKDGWQNEAFSYYHLKDKSVVGLFKWSMVCRSFDEGESWNGPEFAPSLIQPGSKIWGQRTPDGRYALVWNPTHSQNCRWPLAVATSEDGLNFDKLLSIHGEVPPMRYLGWWKSYGPQYMRGISEKQETPDDESFWMSYSINKEDMWVTRVPVPVQSVNPNHLNESFTAIEPNGLVKDWNIYSPRRCPVCVKRYADGSYLELRDSDPYDYARAMRVFPESRRVRVSTRVMLNRCDEGNLYLEITDGKGQVATGVWFDSRQQLHVMHNASPERVEVEYSIGAWYDFVFELDCETQRYRLTINGKELPVFIFSYPCQTLERIEFRTGARRRLPDMYSDPDSADFVQDVDALSDKEYLETIVLVDSVKTAKGREVHQDYSKRER